VPEEEEEECYYYRRSYDYSDGCHRMRVALWVFNGKRGDLRERNMENLKQLNGKERSHNSDTRVGE